MSSKPLKVLIATYWYKPVVNGVVTSVLNLERELRMRGHDVKVLTLSATRRSYKEEHVYHIGSIKAGAFYPDARVPLSHKIFMDELVEWGPDIIHSQCEVFVFPYAKRVSQNTGAPIIHTYHTVYENYTHYFSPNKTIGRRAAALFSKHKLNQVNAVVAPTKKIRNMLLRYGIKQDIYTVPTGVRMSKGAQKIEPYQLDRRKEELGILKTDRVLVTVGRLAKEKNVEELIRYIKRLSKNTKLLIVGDGPYRARLEEYTLQQEASDQVIFTGMIPPTDVPLYYCLGDIFVCASNSEAQGLVYFEALSNGLPVICRKDPCLDDVVLDGENGFQYSIFEQFRDSVEMLLSDKKRYAEMSGTAKQSVKKYSSEAFAETIERTYRLTIG